MIVIPAIDLRGGQCVRLRQGDYDRETVFDADPVAVARRWVDQGAVYLHLVDLDGAKAGRPVNGDTVRSIVESAGVPCQLGGGLRTDDHIAEALRWGVARVILGTRALQDPAWCREVCRRYPGRIVLGLDARDGRVAAQGWLHTSDVSALDLARDAAAWPVAAVVFTDIGRDGMLGGPNLAALAELAATVDVPVFASGGVTTVDDVRQLARLNLSGCIVGRALYEGRLDLKEAIAAVRMSGGRGA
jgi:phosphoribosylformimino-5-aminoimidazole carboxamide ribotide isomerase